MGVGRGGGGGGGGGISILLAASLMNHLAKEQTL